MYPPHNPLSAARVVWTHRAERRIQTHLIRADGGHAGLTGLVADVSERLAGAFPRADAVVVLDLYLGFRVRPGEYILLIDVRDREAPGTCIVKLADDARLAQEMDAWLACQPRGFRGNGVFMALHPHYRADYPHRFAALVYQDAGPHIGADEVVWLEAATLRAVRFDSPDTRTVIGAVRTLFTQLGHVLYQNSRVELPAGGHIALNPARDGGHRRHRLADALHAWTAPAAADVRRQVVAAFPAEGEGFIDPIDYFRYLEDELAAGVPPASVLPRVVRGPAHGDLHGRNVLVGIEQNAVGPPALYDYEHLSCDNLVGWDFVKLETELKIRALEAIYPPGGLAAFAEWVGAFELRLARRTRACHDQHEEWPDRADATARPGEPEKLARLEAVVLGVRREAAIHLGLRNREWLHEYYFLLGCYALYTGHFENQSDRQRAAALVSGGVAAPLCQGLRPNIQEGAT